MRYHFAPSSAGKTWYGIPALYTSEFESALRACVAVQRGGVRTDGRELLYDLLSIAPPSALVARGVPVFRIFQVRCCRARAAQTGASPAHPPRC